MENVILKRVTGEQNDYLHFGTEEASAYVQVDWSTELGWPPEPI